MKKKNKRISFDKYDAVHIYEYLRFYWEEYYSRYPEDRKKMGKFGSCELCERIGKRLERFIDNEDIKQIERSLIVYRRKLNKLKKK